ncbi:MAG TPA: 50S ribosomal protein L9 [Bacillota bacterium]|nr:50S ribosomal protein L9 [Clostridiales bacterium]HPT84608.1 50S ribosomal protein L9 [Bacillota bacterium]
MKVLLLADVRGQGKKGDVVDVSDGYARNYLFPRKLATEVTPAVLAELKAKEEATRRRIEKERAEARQLAERLQSILVKIHAASGEGGKLYGAVTSKDIAEALKEQHGIEIDRRKIALESDIKACGTYTVDVKLYPEVSGKINVVVC